MYEKKKNEMSMTEKINSGKLNLKTYKKYRKFISTHYRCEMNLRLNFESLKK